MTQRNDVGPYRLVRRLGGGAFGQVYEAFHRTSGASVALKMLYPIGAEAGFVREARVSLGRPHPNLVSGYCVGYGATPWIAMQLSRGGTLRDRCGFARLTRVEARHVLLEILRGLHELHTRGLVHRDIKPENVLFEDDAPFGRVRLGDYGGVIAAVSGPGAPFGSPAYQAPECGAGVATAAADIYSVAVIACELLVGGRPSLRPADPAPENHPNKGSEKLPPAVARVLRRALSGSPDARPTARELAAALDRALSRPREMRSHGVAQLRAGLTSVDVISGAFLVQKGSTIELRDGRGLKSVFPFTDARGLALSRTTPTSLVVHRGSAVDVDGDSFAVEPLPECAAAPCAIRRFAGDAIAIVGGERRKLVSFPSGRPLCTFGRPVDALVSVFTEGGDEVVAIEDGGHAVEVLHSDLAVTRPALRGVVARIACSLHEAFAEDDSGAYYAVTSPAASREP